MVFTGAELILDDGRVATRIPQDHDNIAQKLLTDNVVGGTSVGMIRRDVFDAVGGFDESLPSGQDVDLWLRISRRFAVSFVPEVLVRIWQPNDDGRISKNVSATIRGRELFYQKHEQSMLRDADANVWFRDSGWIHHRYAGDISGARRLYLRSIAAKPMASLAYVLLAATFLPVLWLDRLARCKHAVTRWLSGESEPRFADTKSRSATALRGSSNSASS